MTPFAIRHWPDLSAQAALKHSSHHSFRRRRFTIAAVAGADTVALPPHRSPGDTAPAPSGPRQPARAFFTAWEQEEWCTKDSPGYTEATPFVDPFTLVRGVVEGRRCSPRWPWEESECCRGTCRPEIIIQGLPYVEWACRA